MGEIAPVQEAVDVRGSVFFPWSPIPTTRRIVTGVRPVRHGVLSNTIPTPAGKRGRWHEEATDLRASPIWEWARAAGLTTAAVSWPITAGARVDLLVPERATALSGAVVTPEP